MRLLLVEDQAELIEHFGAALRGEGYTVDTAADGDEALRLAGSIAYDLLLLDVTLPGRDGVAVVQQLRAVNVLTPVIFITGRGEVEDRVRGLDAGGDDYLTKPFSLAELLARVRAVLRRHRPEGGNVLRVGDLELDRVAHNVVRAGARIDLTRREFALLEMLALSAPHPVGKLAILQGVFHHASASGANVVNVHLQHLRRKIERPGLAPLLHTIRGVGFALRDTTGAAPAATPDASSSGTPGVMHADARSGGPSPAPRT